MRFPFFGLILIVIIYSCSSINVDPEEVDNPTLVIDVRLNSSDDRHFVYIGYNFSSDEYPETEKVEDIEAYILSPSGERFDFHLKPDSLSNNFNLPYNFILDKKVNFQPGEEYCIFVSKAEYPTLSACSLVPDIVDLKEYDLKDDPAIISFKDPKENNYYYLAGTEGYIFKDLSDPSANSFYTNNSSYIIDDETFNGLDKTFILPIKASYLGKNAILFGVITEDEYEFIKTSRLQEESRRNPYIGEHRIHSNVQDGFGIFAIHNIRYYE